MQTYDTIVVGVGGMGSAAVYHLARRGQRVLGLEQYDIPHQLGSSHGVSRIIRLAYYENPSYVPLLYRAYELWWALERTVQERLLHVTGALNIGSDSSEVFTGALASVRQHNLAHEILDADAVRRRFPGYGLQAPLMALYEPQAGLLAAERCIVAHVTAALAEGADVRGHEAVLGWESANGGVQVRTDRGVYRAGRLVLTAGAWTHRLLARYKGVLQPERQVLVWMQPRVPSAFRMDVFPVFILDVEEGHFYGMPTYGIPGFKIGRFHHLEQRVDDPAAVDRGFHPEDEELLRGLVRRYLPDGDGPVLSTATCHIHQFPGRALRHRLPPRRPARGLRRRLYRPRLQVLLRGRRDSGRPGGRRFHPARHFPVQRRAAGGVDAGARMSLADLERLFGLRGKVALVTGASGGLGKEFARGLAMAGADVAVVARRLERLQETAAELAGFGVRTHAVRADLRCAAQIEAALWTRSGTSWERSTSWSTTPASRRSAAPSATTWKNGDRRWT